MATKVMFGKVVTWTPVAVDVAKLKAAFPNPVVGQEITYKAIEAQIGVHWRTARFSSVLDAWRKHLFDALNVDVGFIPGVAMRILDPMEREKAARGNAREGVRKLGKAYRRVDAIDAPALPPDQRARVDHVKRVTQTMLDAAQREEPKLIRPPPIQPLPKAQ